MEFYQVSVASKIMTMAASAALHSPKDTSRRRRTIPSTERHPSSPSEAPAARRGSPPSPAKAGAALKGRFTCLSLRLRLPRCHPALLSQSLGPRIKGQSVEGPGKTQPEVVVVEARLVPEPTRHATVVGDVEPAPTTAGTQSGPRTVLSRGVIVISDPLKHVPRHIPETTGISLLLSYGMGLVS